MTTTHTGQVSDDAAQVYEEALVPAVFAEWAPRVADAARIGPGHRVLDVACGTGVVAREAVHRVRPGGSVVGLDRNAGMLAVARRKAPEVEWREGRAESLPFEPATFDAATCAFALMYFDDRLAALREMRRVLRPGGRLALVVWDALERQPAEAAVASILAARYGEAAADELRAPFALGDPGEVRALFMEAGLADVEVATVEGSTRASSLASYVDDLLRGWTLAGKLDDEQRAGIVAEAAQRIAPHARRDGDGIVLPAPAHVASARRP